MELRQLEYFSLICQEQNFGRAAQKAFVSQQAISKSIQTLEAELGVQLFVRDHKKFELTEYGEILYSLANEIFPTINEALKKIDQQKKDNKHVIHFAMTNGVEDFINFQKIHGFQENHPEFFLSGASMSDKEIENQLINGTIDFAICGAIGDNSQLDYDELFVHDTLVMMNNNNPLSSHKSLTIADLRNETFVVVSGDYNTYKRLHELCKIHGFYPQIRHRTGNILYMSQLVSNNQGVFISPSTSAHFFDNQSTVQIPIQTEFSLFSICFVTKRGRNLTSPLPQLKEYYKNLLSNPTYHQ